MAGFSEKSIERLYRKCPYLISRKYDLNQIITLRSQYKTAYGRYSSSVGFADILIQPKNLEIHIIELKVTPLIVSDLTDQLLSYIKCLKEVPEYSENQFHGVLIGYAPKIPEAFQGAVKDARREGFNLRVRLLGMTVPEPDQVGVCPVCTSHYFLKRVKQRKDRYRCSDDCFIQSSGNLEPFLKG